MLKIALSFVADEYSGYSKTAETEITLSSYESALALSALSLLLIREAWQPMGDSEWDNLESELSILLDRIADAIQ
jgi:hypothetical protein